MKINRFGTMKWKICLLLIVFSAVPLLASGILFLRRMEAALFTEQKESVNRQLALVNDNIDSVFGSMFDNVRFYAEGALLQTVDSSITSYAGTTESTLMTPGENGRTEQAIFQSFAEFGKSHPAYQYIYMGTEQGGYIQYPDTTISPGFDPRVRPWYPEAKAQPGRPVLGDPYYFSEDDIVIVGVSQAIVSPGGEVTGVMAMDMSLDALTALFEDASAGFAGYYMLIAQDGTILADPSNPLNNFLSVGEAYGAHFSQAVDQGADFLPIDLGEPCFLKSVRSENTGWHYVTVISQRELFRSVSNLQAAMGSILVGVLAVVLVAGFLVSSRFSRPIKAMTICAQRVAEGDFDVSLRVKAKGEIGLLVDSFNRIGETLATYKKYIAEITDVLNDLSRGRVAFALESDYMGEFSSIKQALLNISQTLSAMMSQINESSNQIMSHSQELAAGAQVLGQGSTEQAAAVQQLSGTVAEISQQVNANAEVTKEANSLSKITVNGTVTGNQQMKAMTDAMEEINSKALEIKKIIGVIDEIAFQTNILALNAAVEAARAGVSGKGFAVVADEVRNLAQKTALATQNTAALIEGSIASVERGASLVGLTAESLAGIVENVGQLSGLLERISTASDRQSISIQQTVAVIEQVSSVVQNNAAIAEESAASSQELSGQAGLLNSLVSRFEVNA